MIIEIDDRKFGEDNYEYEISVNGIIKEKAIKDKKIHIDAINEKDIVEIKAKNIIFSSKYGWIVSIIYWILAVLTGSGENNPFGKPFDALLQITSINTSYLKIQANKIWKIHAFELSDHKVEVIKNDFVSTPKYRRKWYAGFVLPINILIILFLILCILAGFFWGSLFARFFVIIPVIGIMCWNVYAYKVLKILRSKHKK